MPQLLLTHLFGNILAFWSIGIIKGHYIKQDLKKLEVVQILIEAESIAEKLDVWNFKKKKKNVINMNWLQSVGIYINHMITLLDGGKIVIKI